MKYRLPRAVVVALLAAAFVAGPSAAALEIAVTVSPRSASVGRPVEVLVRTFIPIGGEGIDLPPPSLSYPAASGLWNVLYPVADYPFDVVARPPTGDEIEVDLVRDTEDGSLWRGAFTPTAAGAWSIVVRNFPAYAPIAIEVAADEPILGSWVIPVAFLLFGIGGGWLLARAIRPPPSRDIHRR
jgi:hypothetical protein